LLVQRDSWRNSNGIFAKKFQVGVRSIISLAVGLADHDRPEPVTCGQAHDRMGKNIGYCTNGVRPRSEVGGEHKPIMM
jgi:hypothetical protein